ncbi:UNVERIFIED_CONTAM: hypothetical protein FKN15_047260 [Acipenser sinensis]
MEAIPVSTDFISELGCHFCNPQVCCSGSVHGDGINKLRQCNYNNTAWSENSMIPMRQTGSGSSYENH